MVHLLLKNSADVNALGGRYGAALQAASARNKFRVQIRRRGLSQSEDPDRAISTTSSETNDYYLTSSDNSLAYPNSNADSRRHRLQANYICMTGLEIVDMLIEHGAGVNTVGGNYGTALHAAVRSGRENVAKMLLASEAQLTDAVTSCYVKGSRVQRSKWVADRKLHRSGDSEGEGFDLLRNRDWIGEWERRHILLDQEESDKERAKFRCGTGEIVWAQKREEVGGKRKKIVWPLWMIVISLRSYAKHVIAWHQVKILSASKMPKLTRPYVVLIEHRCALSLWQQRIGSVDIYPR